MGGERQAPRQTAHRPSSAHHSTCRGIAHGRQCAEIFQPHSFRSQDGSRCVVARVGRTARARRDGSHHDCHRPNEARISSDWIHLCTVRKKRGRFEEKSSRHRLQYRCRQSGKGRMTRLSAAPKTSGETALILLLYLARGLRGFGDGFAILILPAYMTILGYDAAAVGIVATASLLGTALLTLTVGWIAPRHDLRALLLFGAGLMVVTGLAFPNVEPFALIALVAFIGTVNPSGGDLGVLVPLDHAVLARGATDDKRTQVFARYSLIGALCTAVGSLAATLPDLLVSHGSTMLGAFRLMFYAYAALGVLSAVLYRQVPHARGEEQSRHAPLGPSRRTVYKLAALFSVDAFAGGFVAQSLLVLWLFERFDLSLSAAGLFFFWSSTLGAFSFPVASWIAKRIGLVNTMVFTHIPSIVFLILAAFSHNLYLALGLLLLRSALSQIVVLPRTSYVMAFVLSVDRPAAASVT